MNPTCIRCGMCCLIAPCGLGEEINGVCKHLVVNEDLTTECKIINIIGFIGSGCIIRSNVEIFKLHEEMYDITSMKKSILERKPYAYYYSH